MGTIIQFESHRVELAAIYEMEYDADVLEYRDQPPSIKLDYRSPAGRRMGVLHTPDFFVMRQHSAGWEEWKAEESLHKLARHNPNRYCLEGGNWRCPPGEKYALALGFYYRVRSSTEIDWVFQRNVQFLEDYLRADVVVISPPIRETAVSHVAAAPGLSLAELFSRTQGSISRDQIYSLIAAGVLHVDLHRSVLVEPERVTVFPSLSALTGAECQPLPTLAAVGLPAFLTGSALLWDCRTWKIVNIGEREISLLSLQGALVDLPLESFEGLVRTGKVTATTAAASDSNLIECLSGASENDLKVANHRCEQVNNYLRGDFALIEPRIPKRTLCRWVARYRAAERIHGRGYVGLLPRAPNRGNTTPKLPSLTQKLLAEFIEDHYETSKQKTKYAVWAVLKLACENQGTIVPSYRTFCHATRKRGAFNQVVKRQGQRAAYKLEPFCWDLEQKTPRHGDRPLEIVHIDHTQLDLEVVCSTTSRVLGRPWMTLMTDGFSRRILAFCLTFDPPSYRSCMMTVRECVRRHGRLPQILVMDGGREFESVYFETLMARYECIKKVRPPAKARFGSVCERLFGTFVRANKSTILWRSPLCGVQLGAPRQALVPFSFSTT